MCSTLRRLLSTILFLNIIHYKLHVLTKLQGLKYCVQSSLKAQKFQISILKHSNLNAFIILKQFVICLVFSTIHDWF